jgi:hypothetical protein
MISVGYQTADIAQIWPKKKICPSPEDVSRSGLQPNMAEMMPLIGGLVTQRTSAKYGKK